MKMTQRFKAVYNAFLNPSTPGNRSIGREFLRNGNQRPLVQDWSQVYMSDQDLYTGYSYAAINNRANAVSQLAENNLRTSATDSVMKTAKAKDLDVVHPYLKIIDDSLSFTNYDFWYDISTYLDLEGVYYLMAVRNVQSNSKGEVTRVGKVQEFKLLNPYEITKVVDPKDPSKIGGYVERRNGIYREIPPEMIITVAGLNPFSRDDPYAMTDAMKDAQFTLKQAGDYTRHSLKNNMAAPGILSTETKLEPEQFTNFVKRIRNQEKGEPLYGNGGGAINWDSMQIDMDKASLGETSEINRNSIIAVTGASLTMLGIEQSGVTRETSKVQRDLFVSNHIMPQLRRIINALNLDYKKYYQTEYASNQYTMYIDSPLGVDVDVETKEAEVRTSRFELYSTLRSQGYSHEVASKYADGEIELEDVGEPTEDVETETTPTVTDTPAADDTNVEDNAHDHSHDYDITPIIRNQLGEDEQRNLSSQQATLQNTIVNIDERIVVSALTKIAKTMNAFESESDIMSETEKESYVSELEAVLSGFYGVLFTLYGSSVLSRRLAEFGTNGTGVNTKLTITQRINNYIKNIAKKGAQSHVDTVLADILRETREQALQGASQQEMISAIRKKYAQTISRTRAQTIARTETNRAFTMAQYEADYQFIHENGYENRAYKQWITRSGNPCPLCRSKAAQGRVPFDIPFNEIGDEVSASYEENGKMKVLKQKVTYETIHAGNLHPNCSCSYLLIIE